MFPEQRQPVGFMAAFCFGECQQDLSFFTRTSGGQITVDGCLGSFIGQVPAPTPQLGAAGFTHRNIVASPATSFDPGSAHGPWVSRPGPVLTRLICIRRLRRRTVPMKTTFAFVVGLGVGLLVGTPAGREQLDRVRSWGEDLWNDPRVQDYVQQAQEQAVTFAKEQGSILKDQVNDVVSGLGTAGDTPA